VSQGTSGTCVTDHRPLRLGGRGRPSAAGATGARRAAALPEPLVVVAAPAPGRGPTSPLQTPCVTVGSAVVVLASHTVVGLGRRQVESCRRCGASRRPAESSSGTPSSHLNVTPAGDRASGGGPAIPGRMVHMLHGSSRLGRPWACHRFAAPYHPRPGLLASSGGGSKRRSGERDGPRRPSWMRRQTAGSLAPHAGSVDHVELERLSAQRRG